MNILFNKWCWENWTTRCRTIILEYFLILYTHINLKQIKYLNVRTETRKFLEENQRKKCLDIGFGNNFLDMIPKTQRAKAKHNQQNEMTTYEKREIIFKSFIW